VKDQELVELYLSRCREVQNPLRLCEYNYQQEASSAPSTTAASVQMLGGEELDLDFNTLAIELDKAKGVNMMEEDLSTEQTARALLEQMKRDWRSVDLQKLKSLKPSAALLRSLRPLQPMPCKPMFFDLAIHHLKVGVLHSNEVIAFIFCNLEPYFCRATQGEEEGEETERGSKAVEA